MRVKQAPAALTPATPARPVRVAATPPVRVAAVPVATVRPAAEAVAKPSDSVSVSRLRPKVLQYCYFICILLMACKCCFYCCLYVSSLNFCRCCCLYSRLRKVFGFAVCTARRGNCSTVLIGARCLYTTVACLRCCSYC